MYTKLRLDKFLSQQIEALITSGLMVIGSDGRLKPKAPSGAYQSPWVFINQNSRKKFCYLWNGIYCSKFKLIPRYCRQNCWKTVIKPRTLKEVMICYEKMKILDLPSKIGADRRDYTYGAWAGFIYADSLEQGRRYYKMLRAMVPEEIPIILKRGCTEMERLVPSKLWDMIENDEIDAEDFLNDVFNFSEDTYIQSEWHKQKIMESWIRRAIEIGDPTAREMAEKLSGNQKIWGELVVNSLTYHDKDPRDEQSS